MSTLFCCSFIKPYRPQRLDHERKFDTFMQWAKSASPEPSGDSLLVTNADYAVQLVKQVSYGPQESIRYFVPISGGIEFAEITENDLITANFEKLNSYKNFKCSVHDKFFEINLYQENPINKHHWRANIARPATDIDLVYRQKKVKETLNIKTEDVKQDDQRPNPEHGGASVSGQLDPNLQTHEPASQLNIPTLKSVLRFLLPTVKTNLGPNPLLSLLSLDWADKELDLGLEIESLWEAKLNSDNIVTFLSRCVKLSVGGSATRLAAVEIENAVGYVVGRTALPKKDQVHGRSKFQEILNQVFKRCSSSNWVVKSQEGVLRMFTAGPDEHLLELCQRIEDEEQDSRAKHELSADRKTREDDYYNNEYDYDYEYENSHDDDFDKDLTACDKECGYCGRCSY